MLIKTLTVFLGLFLMCAALPAAVLADAEKCLGGSPCQVVFTLDEENNIVLEEITGNHRNEGVLRLTTEQAESAALGPISKSNILSPEMAQDEFSETIKALASVPGLSFLKGQSTASGTAARSAAPVSRKCAQMRTVMEATLKDAQEGRVTNDDFITPAEVAAVCPQAKASALNSWYSAEKSKYLTQ
mgnify:CR=1 FL=1